MNALQPILKTIFYAENEGTRLNIEDTLQILEALKCITTNKILIDKAISLFFLVKKKEHSLPKLSKRENQIFKLIGVGFTSREIALALNISEATISTHRKNMIKKLGLQGPGKLQNIAYKHTETIV